MPIVLLSSLVILIKVMLRGKVVEVLSPKGLIASEQRQVMFGALLLLLLIGIPAIFTLYHIAWKYRESNKKAKHIPHARHSRALVFTIWALPSTTLIFLVMLMWPAAHELAPQKPIVDGVKPLRIQVVALRWKWLFIYPEQDIATVNFVQIPTGTPVQFDLSADEAPMNSFWIPQLAGQLYAMTGHVNRLNLVANTSGDYQGSAAEINGDGFAGMRFITRASSMDDFNTWTQRVRQSPLVLEDAEYQNLLKPSQSNSEAYYSKTDPSLYSSIVDKYSGSHGQHTEQK